MKKTISILLSVIMVLTCFTAFADTSTSDAMEKALIAVKTKLKYLQSFRSSARIQIKTMERPTILSAGAKKTVLQIWKFPVMAKAE